MAIVNRDPVRILSEAVFLQHYLYAQAYAALAI